MKQILLLIALVSVSQIGLASRRGNITAPDRESASAAVLLQDDGTIQEPTIPSNVIAKPEVAIPSNKILEGKPEKMDAPIDQAFIVQ